MRKLVLLIIFLTGLLLSCNSEDSNSEITVEDETTWTTGSLPTGVPEEFVSTPNRESSQAGWTLMNKAGRSNTPDGSDYPATDVMYDQDGLPVWYFINGTSDDLSGGVATELLNNK